MYTKKTWYLLRTVEVEKTYQWRYGAPGMPRSAKKKATPEDIERQNQWVAEKKLRRTINLNFKGDDLHLILTYRKDNRPEKEQQPKILKDFLKDMRRDYRKAGCQFKYILATEYGSRGAVHHHLIINNITQDGISTTRLVTKNWKYGRPMWVPLDDTGEYKDLAEYIIKDTSKSFRMEGNPFKQRYTCSRNLEKPVPVVEKMSASRWRDEPKITPKMENDGWWLDYDSIVTGFNRVTGYPYQYYTLRRICDMTSYQRRKYEIFKKTRHWPSSIAEFG